MPSNPLTRSSERLAPGIARSPLSVSLSVSLKKQCSDIRGVGGSIVRCDYM